MDVAAVASVRRFNRVVTQRIGVLSEEHLELGRPLGACRVLWEIGDGADVRSLRTRLDLDSGYLSRLLRGLEREGLVSVDPSQEDARVHVATLTAKGRAEVGRLDSQSDELAWSFLEPLDGTLRERLVDAMGVVERLLTAALVTTEVVAPSSPDAQFCLRAYYEELDARFEDGLDMARITRVGVEEMTEPRGLILVARLRDAPVGCGVLRFHGDEPAEIKRMWVASETRGLGLGRRLLRELERIAADRGATVVHLETNRVLTEAIELYRSSGYREVERFNDEPYGDHWFEKEL